MKYFILISILTVYLFASCKSEGLKNVNTQMDLLENNQLDTLKIGYLDTILTGKQLFPQKADSIYLDKFIKEDILLVFESGEYLFVFYNSNKIIDFLSANYWQYCIPKYINKIQGGMLNNSYLNRIDYSEGPYITGLYSVKDSIIAATSDFKNSNYSKKQKLRITYFSTSDSILKLNENISVGSNYVDVINEIKLSKFNTNKNKIVLLNATSLINNAWYIGRDPKCYMGYSDVVILSFRDKHLVEVKYLDFEKLEYVFKKIDISAIGIANGFW